MINNIEELVPTISGNEMPGFGFGCYKIIGEELTIAVNSALDCGYRYIDSAAFYNNEETLGNALRKTQVSRNKIFVVSKIWPSDFYRPVDALDKSLHDLKLDYIDGYLLHWPGIDERLRLKAYEVLLREQEKGKIRVLGVSNFLINHLEEIYSRFHLWPAINQVEVHPLFQQKDLCDFSMANSIRIVSWSPLGRGREMELKAVRDLATLLGKSAAQILLRWQIQKNYVPVPKSAHPERIRQNADIFNFALSHEQMELLDNLELPDARGRMGKDPTTFAG